jgi:hypothetical protein
MLAVAGRYPLETWTRDIEPEEVFAEFREQWHGQGMRPANHPLNRLRQYHRWVAAHPDWPQRLLDRMPFKAALAAQNEIPTRIARQLLGLKTLREDLAGEILSHAVGGTRMDNLVADGFLPLLAAQTGNELGPTWYHWFIGDIPAQLRLALPRLGLVDGRGWPYCQGGAQGLLGWILGQQARASG